MCISEGGASGLSHMYNNLETLVLSRLFFVFSCNCIFKYQLISSQITFQKIIIPQCNIRTSLLSLDHFMQS